jgi:hypothetical protein
MFNTLRSQNPAHFLSKSKNPAQKSVVRENCLLILSADQCAAKNSIVKEQLFQGTKCLSPNFSKGRRQSFKLLPDIFAFWRERQDFVRCGWTLRSCPPNKIAA